jgi:hypothetical protein
MIRPWKVVLTVALGAALLPSSAMAQSAGPDITITNPAANATYKVGDPVNASFQCLPKPQTTVTECTAVLANGAAATSGQTALPTTTAGPGSLTVTAKDSAGNTSTLTNNYSVVESDPGDVGGSTPPTMNLALGQPGVFAPFVPGVAGDYTTTVTAQILSTAGDAVLSVADPSANQTGHLVNGAFALAAPLQIAGGRPQQTDANGQPIPVPPLVFAPVGGSSAPTTLITYDGPLNETDTITFKQPIGQLESLRTGGYTKTLTFTLSTTNP